MSTAVQDIEALQGILQPLFPEVEADGDIGKRTMGALHRLTDRGLMEAIQRILAQRFPEVNPDGKFGPITFSAIRALDELGDHESLVDEYRAGTVAIPTGENWKIVKASSFADPKDIEAFRQCKRKGGTDGACFAVGDNGIGAWGADTTQAIPMVALPREIWRAAGKRGGATVDVLIPEQGGTFRAYLGDTMPSLSNIKNGAGMDCNPEAVRLLGKRPPMMLGGVGWRWARAD